jgi:hypothetical protein
METDIATIHSLKLQEKSIKGLIKMEKAKSPSELDEIYKFIDELMEQQESP